MFENLEDAQSIDLEIELRIVHRALVCEVRGEVVYDLRMAMEGMGEVLLVQDVAFYELNLRIPAEVPFVRRREVVEDENTLYVELGQGKCEVGTDGARAARSEERRVGKECRHR